MKTFKQYIEELTVRDAAGHPKIVKKVPIRMADGTVKKMNPGKS